MPTSTHSTKNYFLGGLFNSLTQTQSKANHLSQREPKRTYTYRERPAFQNAQTHMKHGKRAASRTGSTKALHALQKTATPPNSHVTLRQWTSKGNEVWSGHSIVNKEFL